MSVTVVTEIVILGRLGKIFHFYEVNGSENSLPHEVISKKKCAEYHNHKWNIKQKFHTYSIFGYLKKDGWISQVLCVK